MPAIAIRAQPTPAQWSERVLLRRVLGRDERAWRELIRRYRALIFRCISNVTSKSAPYLPAADVDDIYAEVLLGLVRNDMHKLRRYNPARGVKLGSWIGMLSINATYDYLRSAGRAQRLIEHTEVPIDIQPDHDRTPLEELIEKERWHQFNQLLTDFTARDRRFLELYYGRGLEAPAIAEDMTISVKTVYSKKHKIRAHLRRSLESSRRAHALADLVAAA